MYLWQKQRTHTRESDLSIFVKQNSVPTVSVAVMPQDM